MTPHDTRLRRSPFLLFPLAYLLLFAGVVLTHLTLLHLPYFWDEGGYYVPAALDFYRHGWLVPHYTNAHPPLPNIILGSLWHVFGFHIVVTRLIVCAFAAAALLAVYRLTQALLDTSAAVAVTLLTAVYPIFFAQSTLAHADIFAAAFTLWAFALYIPASNLACHPERSEGSAVRSDQPRYLLVATLFTLAVLSKETSIIQPASLSALELFLFTRSQDKLRRRDHLRWLAALSFPLLPLLAWYAYHHHVTGFTFGNPEFLRYNATANLTPHHILTAFYYRFLHLFTQRFIWLPIAFTLAALFLRPESNTVISTEGAHLRRSGETPVLSTSNFNPTSAVLCLLIFSNWLAFSVLGGALLTRYLLPIYPLILLLCVAVWRTRPRLTWTFTAVTAAAFIAAWWINPPTSFAPEDNLTYRDMILAHQQAIDYVAQHYPSATVLTAWPVSSDLFNSDLGYVTHPIKAVSIEDFTLASVRKAAEELQQTHSAPYDTAIVFTTHFLEPNFRRFLLTHPDSFRGRQFATSERDLSPEEIAHLLGSHVVVTFDHHGEWAAVLRFDRSYDAHLLR